MINQVDSIDKSINYQAAKHRQAATSNFQKKRYTSEINYFTDVQRFSA